MKKKQGIGNFVKLPDAVLFDEKLKSRDKEVYSALRSHRQERSKSTVRPSCAFIASSLGCSKSTVRRSVNRLRQQGHIIWISGNSHKSNEYSFTSIDKDQKASISESQTNSAMNRDGVKAEAFGVSPVNTQPELYNQSNEPERSLRLFHGSDQAFISDEGSVRVKIHTGDWVEYSGGDDENFRFGSLRGKEALNKAKKYFQGIQKKGINRTF